MYIHALLQSIFLQQMSLRGVSHPALSYFYKHQATMMHYHYTFIKVKVRVQRLVQKIKFSFDIHFVK